MEHCCPDATDLNHSQNVIAADGRRRGVHNRSAGLSGKSGAMKLIPGLRRRLCPHICAIHAALELPQIFRARHDFLTRITSLVEADPADQVEIDHLRHEHLLGLRTDHRNARCDLEPIPASGTARLRPAGQLMPEPGRVLDQRCHFETGWTEPDDTGLRFLKYAPGTFWDRTEYPHQLWLSHSAGHADAYHFVAPGAGRQFGSKNEHGQPLFNRFQQLKRKLHMKSTSGAPQQKTREYSALGRVVASVLADTGSEPADVIAQLALQEICGVMAREIDDAEM